MGIDALEVLPWRSMSVKNLSIYGVSLACGISPTHFELTAPALSIDSTLLVAVLGVACALVARAFCWLLHTMEHEMPRRLPNP